jgi:hypothetical protein
VWVRASMGKYLSIDEIGVDAPSVQIQARWFHATFPGNPYRKNPDG